MAVVREIRGLKRSFGAPYQPGWVPPEAAPPHAEETTTDLQIVQNDDGFFLVSESTHPHCGGGDIWHKTFEDAIAQAEFQFGVRPSDWRPPAEI